MRIILLHSDEFEYEPKKKAIKSAEQIEMGVVSVKEALVAMMAVETADERDFDAAAIQSVKEITAVADELKITNIVIYPWVHLTSTPSRPDIALKVMRKVESEISKLGDRKSVV